MEQFDDIKKIWRSQEETNDIDQREIRIKAEKQIRSQQKRLLLTNFGLTVSFIVVIGVLVWIYTSFPDRSVFFKLSIVAMGTLMIAFLAGMWSGLLYRNIDPNNKPEKFIKYAARKIRIRLFMLEKGVPLYFVLLFAALVFYLADVLSGWEFWLIVLSYMAIFTYMLVIWYFFRKKRRRQILQYKDILNMLNQWRASLR